MKKNKKETQKVLIHIHVPKCAGSSVNHTIRSRYPDRSAKYVSVQAFRNKVNALSQGKEPADRAGLETAQDLLSSWEAFLKASNSERDQRYDVVYGHLLWGYHELFDREVTYFSIARPVLSRVLSFFNFVQSNPKHPQHEFFGKTLRSLNDLTPDFLEQHPRLRKQWGNYFCMAYTGHAVKNDTDYEAAEKAILAEIDAGRFVCGSVPHIEKFAKSMGLIESTLPNMNVTPLDKAQDFEVASKDTLTKSTRELLESINQYDLRLLDRIAERQEKRALDW